MSKIGKKNIAIPAGVEIKVDDAGKITVKGPKGELSYTLVAGVKAEVVDNEIVVSDSNEKKNLRGLTRTLIDNMVVGVTHGYEKKLLLIGVGYTAKKEGTGLLLALGFSHKVKFDIPASLKCEVEQDIKGNYVITIQGIDKRLLGQVAANLKSLKEPEPYKGKGFRYSDEYIKLKPGRAAKKA